MTGDSTGEDVAQGIVFGAEFGAKGFDNTAYVSVLYRAFFGRAADTAGLNGWVNALEQGNLNRAEVLSGFIRSREFTNLANSYNIVAYASAG